MPQPYKGWGLLCSDAKCLVFMCVSERRLTLLPASENAPACVGVCSVEHRLSLLPASAFSAYCVFRASCMRHCYLLFATYNHLIMTLLDESNPLKSCHPVMALGICRLLLANMFRKMSDKFLLVAVASNFFFKNLQEI